MQGELRYAYGAYTINASIQLRDANPNRSYPLTLWAQAVGSSDIYETSTTLYGASGTVQIFVPEPGLYRLQAFVPGGSWLRGEVSVAVGLEVRNLLAVPGNRCVALIWEELPANAFSGYRVYRRVGSGAWTLVDTLPSAAFLFGDTSLTNGTTYRYKIAVVGLSGEVLSESQVVSAVPTGAVPQLVWDSSYHQGDVFVVQVRPSQSANFEGGTGFLLVNKEPYTSIGASPESQPNAPRLFGTVEMTNLPSGAHTLQAVLVGQYAYITPVISVNLSNDINDVSVPSIMWMGRSEEIRASLPSDTTGWTVQVLDIDDRACRQWSGSGTRVHLVWDGTDQFGIPLEDGLYFVSITAQRPNGSRTVNRAVTRIPRYPAHLDAIALISNITGKPDRDYAKHVAFHMRRIKQRAGGGFDYRVLVITRLANIKLVSQLRNWMSSSLRYFYLYGHGNTFIRSRDGKQIPSATWGGIDFQADDLEWSVPSDKTFVVRHIVGSRDYRFVFIDACNSAGFYNTAPNLEFQIAFNAEAFVGWQGEIYANAVGIPEEDWFIWRRVLCHKIVYMEIVNEK